MNYCNSEDWQKSWSIVIPDINWSPGFYGLQGFRVEQSNISEEPKTDGGVGKGKRGRMNRCLAHGQRSRAVTHRAKWQPPVRRSDCFNMARWPRLSCAAWLLVIFWRTDFSIHVCPHEHTIALRVASYRIVSGTRAPPNALTCISKNVP